MRSFVVVTLTVAMFFMATDRLPGDPVLSTIPLEIRKACEEAFPGYRVLKLIEHFENGKKNYFFTLFDPSNNFVQHQKIGNDMVSQLLLETLVVNEDGQVLEESKHSIPETQVPQPVLESYKKWKTLDSPPMGIFWGVERKRDKERTYMVSIIINEILSYHAVYNADGTPLEEGGITR